MGACEEKKPLHRGILATVLYYDIWEHPLSLDELYAFLPCNAGTFEEFREFVCREGPGPHVKESDGLFFLASRSPDIAARRRRKEALARKRWKMALLAAHVIKRFPFVRGLFVSGDLSKNISSPESDIDFVVITLPGRLWIARTLLMVFKKIVLLDSKKYFCLNTFSSVDGMHFCEHNYYTAMEIATLKPLVNRGLFTSYLAANRWITGYFPNYDPARLPIPARVGRNSVVQRVCESILSVLPLDRIESHLLVTMRLYWLRKYPEFDDDTRSSVLRSTRSESLAYLGNYRERILRSYDERLSRYGLPNAEHRENRALLLATG